MSQRFAVIGNPIDHSLSPLIHQHFAKQTGVPLIYEKIKGDEASFEHQVQDFFNQGGRGLNVTLPFKQRAFALAQHRSPLCQLAGAANTLWIQKEELHADNTDGVGLQRDLAHYLNIRKANILLLGAGGAARGIIPSLFAMKPQQIIVANRGREKLEALLQDFPKIKAFEKEAPLKSFNLIINATSASITGASLTLPPEIMSQKPFCYDLAYQQKGDTSFVLYAKSMGCNAVDGLGMLVEQAAESFYLWHGVRPATKEILTLLR